MDTILYHNASTDSVPSKVEKNGNVATLSYKHGAKLELTATEDYLAYRIQGGGDASPTVSAAVHNLQLEFYAI